MLHGLVLLVTGIGFVAGTVGFTNGEQGSVPSIFENPIMQTTSEYTAERRKSKNGGQHPTEAGVQHSVARSVDRYPFVVAISGSLGSTLAVPRRIDTKHFQRKLHLIQNRGRPKMNFGSVLIPIFGQYMSFSRNRISPRILGTLSEEVTKNWPGSQDDEKESNNEGTLGTSSREVTKNWPGSQDDEKESNNEGTLGTSSREVTKNWPGSQDDEKESNNEGTLGTSSREVTKNWPGSQDDEKESNNEGTLGTSSREVTKNWPGSQDDEKESNNEGTLGTSSREVTKNWPGSQDDEKESNNEGTLGTSSREVTKNWPGSQDDEKESNNEGTLGTSSREVTKNWPGSQDDEKESNNEGTLGTSSREVTKNWPGSQDDEKESNNEGTLGTSSREVTKNWPGSQDDEKESNNEGTLGTSSREVTKNWPGSQDDEKESNNEGTLGTSSREVTKNWPGSQDDEKESNNEGTLGNVASTSPVALIPDNPGNKRNKRLSNKREDNPLSGDPEALQTLPKSKIEKLLEFGAGHSGGSCTRLFKALLFLIADKKANRNPKPKRSPRETANQTKDQTPVSNRGSSVISRDHSISTSSVVVHNSISPNESSLLNSRPLSERPVHVNNNILTDNSYDVSDAKNTSVELSIVYNKTISTIRSMLKNRSAPTKVPTTDKFISTETLASDYKPTSTEQNELNNNSGSTKSSVFSTYDNPQIKNGNESALPFISLPTEDYTSDSKNGSYMRTKTAPSITQLMDYITSFITLSSNILDSLRSKLHLKADVTNKVGLKADVVNKQRKRTSPSTEVSVVKDMFTRLVSGMFVPADNIVVKYNSTVSQNNQSQSREDILLTNEIAKRLNVTSGHSRRDRNASTVQEEFRTLIGLARLDSKYVKEWRDSVLAFLSKQSHHFKESGIYEKLTSFWPRSSLTAESWTLRIAGYCAQIEIDQNLAVLESGPLFCPFKNPKCDKSAKYRDPTGICNNLENPLWGSANIPFRRQLKNVYDDGVSKPRIFGKGGVPLPSAKLISKSVFDKNDGKAKTDKMNLFTVFFTQFVSHDVTRFAMDIGDIGPVKVNCCLPDTLNRSECFPIFVEEEKNEPTANGSVRCLHFLRSMPTVPLGCQSHVREQINQVTSFIDASNVYGSSLQEMEELRLFQRGLMKMALCGPESLPPTDRKGASECGINADERQFPCFYAGDPRVNENPALALVHVLWLREHNRIARRLGEINPHWNDTRLYEETRGIISALMQHIVYNELLPLIIGFEKAKEFGLLSGVGFFKDYEPKTNPTLENGVSTAAFRFGHGMISDRFLFLAGCPSAHSKCSPDSILNGILIDQEISFVSDHLIPPHMCPYMTRKNVSAMFENVDVFHHSETELESLLRGLLMESAEVATDTMLTPAITEKLFGHMDLMARNIQRARDHGLPAYNGWREWCGLPVARNFHSNKTGFVDHKMETVKRFAQVYKHPEDVDLIIGGLTEIPIEGGILGPTFVCMIGRQFRQLKFGDRFWYETEGHFTEDQLREIRLIKVSHILLNNAGIGSVPKFSFYKGSNDNPFITSIDQIQLELSLWKEEEEKQTK